MKPQNVADAIELAYESLKGKPRFWREDEGEFALDIEVLSVCSETSGPVMERDGRWLVYDGDGNLVPSISGNESDDPDKYLIYDDEKGARLIARAEEGDPYAIDVLRMVAAGFVEAGCAMPHRLRKYILHFFLLTFRAAQGSGQRGPDPHMNFLRNVHIADTIALVVKQGFRPTRNRATTTVESACSIVARALPRIGVHLSESVVEKIWGEFSNFEDDSS